MMKAVIRVTLTLFIVVVIYLIVYWKFLSPQFQRSGPASNIVALLIGLFIGIILWKKRQYFE